MNFNDINLLTESAQSSTDYYFQGLLLRMLERKLKVDINQLIKTFGLGKWFRDSKISQKIENYLNTKVSDNDTKHTSQKEKVILDRLLLIIQMKIRSLNEIENIKKVIEKIVNELK
jgi:hypothetical protein